MSNWLTVRFDDNWSDDSAFLMVVKAVCEASGSTIDEVRYEQDPTEAEGRMRTVPNTIDSMVWQAADGVRVRREPRDGFFLDVLRRLEADHPGAVVYWFDETTGLAGEGATDSDLHVV